VQDFILPKASDVTRPMAARGLTSYRYRSTAGHVAIGARDHADALREAARSITGKPDPARLDVWSGTEYVPAH
jgi:hypothetical protein